MSKLFFLTSELNLAPFRDLMNRINVFLTLSFIGLLSGCCDSMFVRNSVGYELFLSEADSVFSRFYYYDGGLRRFNRCCREQQANIYSIHLVKDVNSIKFGVPVNFRRENDLNVYDLNISCSVYIFLETPLGEMIEISPIPVEIHFLEKWAK